QSPLNMNASTLVFLISLVLSASAMAQSSTVPTTRLGVTTLVLAADVSNEGAAPAPDSRVRVPPLEQVRLLVPEGWSHPIQWTKDGRTIPGANARVLDIPLASSTD